jgi:hypothetical protein
MKSVASSLRGVSFAYIRGSGVAVMTRDKVRCLCAQIAIETNPDKVDALIAELTQLLVGDYMNKRAKAEDFQRKIEVSKSFSAMRKRSPPRVSRLRGLIRTLVRR